MRDDSLSLPGRSLTQVHQSALRILSEIGIQVDHVEMCERLLGSGCLQAGGRIRIAPDLVENTIRAIPGRFVLHGRTGRAATVDVDGPMLCTNTGIMPNIYDFDTGKVRRSIYGDVVTSTRVLDALPQLDIVYVSLVDPTDMPPHLVTVTAFAATLANTTKPLIGPGVVNRAEAEAIVTMAAALWGGDRRELMLRPPCAPFVCPLTPLRFTSDMVDALGVVAAAGLPLTVITNPVMGVTAPYTIAGTVALGHAEMLATAVMANTIRPGLPILSLNTPSVADMRTMASTTGGPEAGLLRRTAVEVAQELGIPCWAHGHTSSARLDVQATDEKSLNSLLLASARPSLLGGLGGLANVTLTSYEALLLDDERFGALRRILRGVAVDEDHLGFSVIQDMIGGSDVISHAHTVAHLRDGEVWRPALVRREGLVNGRPAGEPALDRARAVVKRIMDAHHVAPLSPLTADAIAEIIRVYDANSIAGH